MGVSVNEIKLTALVDFGSSESYTNSDTSKKMGVKPIPSNHNVQIASAAMKMISSGFCDVDVTINDKKYEATRLNVLDNLCSNIILGLDFQIQHHRLTFEFNGNSFDLIVSNDSKCSLVVADTKGVALFSNVTFGVKPIATKLRCFNEANRVFTQKTVDKWLKEGII